MNSVPEQVAEEAFKWQRMAGVASFLEARAAGGVEEGRVYELAGQMASTGERLSLAHAAAVEVALWRQLRQAGEQDPEHDMCMRALAEAQCQFVVGAGHSFANVAARALALDKRLRSALGEKFDSAFPPFSRSHQDWPPMNDGTCRKIDEVSKSGTDDPDLVRPVVELGGTSAWSALLDRRNWDFHRWRPQTHGIEGVPQRSPWTREEGVRRMTIGHPVYDEAEDLPDETADIASEAMTLLSHSMDAFFVRLPIARKQFSGFQLS